MGGTRPGALCATWVSSRGPLETWEFPVGPGCPPRRPPVANPQRGFSTTQQEREEAATEPGAPNLWQVSHRNGAPGPRQKRQQHTYTNVSNWPQLRRTGRAKPPNEEFEILYTYVNQLPASLRRAGPSRMTLCQSCDWAPGLLVARAWFAGMGRSPFHANHNMQQTNNNSPLLT